MPTIVCTPAGSTDNCYVTLATANSWFADTMRDGEWRGWSDDDRERALIQATKEIEALGGVRGGTTAARYGFHGTPSNSTQALHFPRTTDGDSTGAYVVPTGIVDAVCEQAIGLLRRRDKASPLDVDGLRADGVMTVSMDGLSATWIPNRRPPHVSIDAWIAVRPYIRSVGRTRVR